uniref:Uncharacterized protein n=1 Tax=Mycena pura TaxID=153505 RepID=A0AAD6V1P1_9AGAR|nr:hypothetical protein GGX14DRAFT_660587 [Mycena pura]
MHTLRRETSASHTAPPAGRAWLVYGRPTVTGVASQVTHSEPCIPKCTPGAQRPPARPASVSKTSACAPAQSYPNLAWKSNDAHVAYHQPLESNRVVKPVHTSSKSPYHRATGAIKREVKKRTSHTHDQPLKRTRFLRVVGRSLLPQPELRRRTSAIRSDAQSRRSVCMSACTPFGDSCNVKKPKLIGVAQRPVDLDFNLDDERQHCHLTSEVTFDAPVVAESTSKICILDGTIQVKHLDTCDGRHKFQPIIYESRRIGIGKFLMSIPIPTTDPSCRALPAAGMPKQSRLGVSRGEVGGLERKTMDVYTA